jgi:hypothetical protein
MLIVEPRDKEKPSTSTPVNEDSQDETMDDPKEQARAQKIKDYLLFGLRNNGSDGEDEDSVSSHSFDSVLDEVGETYHHPRNESESNREIGRQLGRPTAKEFQPLPEGDDGNDGPQLQDPMQPSSR